ncbi:MAG TPA: RCC1 domain-containing protein [Candidatus Acidoferrales bacterium]|nr:RCC1 domain-containing protein [Candidatus Acidoferrales bacterium]
MDCRWQANPRACATAAGDNHCIAVQNNGTFVAWGDNTFGETNSVIGFSDVKLIAGGDDFTLATQFSPTTMYPVNVSQDLLLVYNSNSSDSSNLCSYYLAHRPMVTNANVLGVDCEIDMGEFYDTTNTWDPQVVTPVLNWLTNNPTKHPTYIILFYDIPTRIWNSSVESGCGGQFPYIGSTSYQIYRFYPGWKPFVNHINAGSLADCEAYVDKIANMATNFPGKLVISASAAEYGNTNYALDNVRTGPGFPPQSDYSGEVGVSPATNSLIADGVSPSSILYIDGIDTITVTTNGDGTLQTNDYFPPQLTNDVNVAGYISWGEHSIVLGNDGATYATNGVVRWSGDSGWWIIETFESFNGMRGGCGQGDFVQWFSSNAFGGTNYSNTPVGAVCHVEEPGLGGNEVSAVYFGLWASGKNFAICAWNARETPYFQAVGDPFVIR